MPRWIQWLFGISIAILLVGAPIGYANYRQATFRNFRTVRADVLYRSGQLGLGGLKRVINDYAIRTVITLRDAAIAGETPRTSRRKSSAARKTMVTFGSPPAAGGRWTAKRRSIRGCAGSWRSWMTRRTTRS